MTLSIQNESNVYLNQGKLLCVCTLSNQTVSYVAVVEL
jgi:hypothetical protein